jgi:hypothetical protein
MGLIFLFAFSCEYTTLEVADRRTGYSDQARTLVRSLLNLQKLDLQN